MYNPSPFLISTAALTSIFSFFFGGYFHERQKAYRLWIQYRAYGVEILTEKEKKVLCSELETKERVFRQAKGLLKILLFTLCFEFIVFQFYSFKYIMVNSSFYQPDTLHTYIWFSAIIGIIVLINIFEMVYILVAVARSDTFPYFKLRRRVTGQDRLSMLWRMCDCKSLKNEEFSGNKIPEKFYKDLTRNTDGL
jgi:hypothetical protein